ncbi:hypothetical protein AcV5_001535 [Taiwanofungus camphoratus]|nr:hypothetical protein AcV5_001535 [Antrodia cinnamomea]
MTSAKDRHYWRQLRETLTAGRWDDKSPARTPNGSPLSWSELLRKFNKHCVGYTDVAEFASQTQALALLLSANASDRSLDGNEVSTRGALMLGSECMLPEERIEEGITGYSALKKLESNFDVRGAVSINWLRMLIPVHLLKSIRLAVAYYAYALRRPAECLSVLAEVKSLSDVQGGTPASGGISEGSVSSATDSAVSAISSASVADISDGTTWSITESIRSICLQGMSHESVSPEEPHKAFAAYLTARPLIANVASDILPSVPSQPIAASVHEAGASDQSSFARYRELWRWVERLLRRAIILGSRLCDIRREDQEHGVLWSLFEHYHTCSAHWPPAYRSEQRSTIAVLYLRAFVLRANALSPSPATVRVGEGKPNRWISTARSVIQGYRAILSVSTRFPRAGERNAKVEDLVDLCVAVWEADGAVGEYAGWVVDVLWWATRLTFNSYKVFRHMSRLLYVSGDPELAKRTLRLYVQVVSKARQTSDAEAHSGGGLDVEIDTDRNWVQTLIQGARMLCRLALAEEELGTAVEKAKEANVMIENAKTRLDADDKELVGGVQLAEGIWHSVMAITERDPRTRSARFSDSFSLLAAAVETFPTPSAHFHLALAYARPGPSLDMQKAIEQSRLAVEGEPGEIRHWHLLGLLLAATGDWRAAKGVLEIGAGVGEVDLADDPPDMQVSKHVNGANGVHVHDYALTEAQSSLQVNGANGLANGHLSNGAVDFPHQDSGRALTQNEPITLLCDDATELPASASLSRPLPDRPSPSRQELFEHALQLRMTQLTLTEFVEGPEGVGEKWVEVFHWFSERREVGQDDRRLSIDSRREETKPRPEPLFSEKNLLAQTNGIRTSTVYSSIDIQTDQIPTPLAPIPITVTPASPGLPSAMYSNESSLTERPRTREDTITEKRSSFEYHSREISRGKKVREVLKNRVHKGQERITTISKIIGHNVGRHGGVHLKRFNSAPNLHAVLSHSPYQASSIHLRQHLSIYASQQDLTFPAPPPPPPPPPPPLPSLHSQSPASTLQKRSYRAARDRRLLSNLWLMSAATFRRLGKIEQARAAIQEAEVKDENNPAVWVQLGLYYMALNNERRALETFQKALFISPEDVAATIHLCRIYLASSSQPQPGSKLAGASRDNVDLSVGLLSDLTRGAGWDVPEAWYFLAKMYGLQGRKDRERECLSFALTLSETRGVRDIGMAVGWCL